MDDKTIDKTLEESLKEVKKMLEPPYKARFLSWSKSYQEEVDNFRALILDAPADVKLLKQEYEQLTGKQFRRKKDE
jgi:hypothetical protein